MRSGWRSTLCLLAFALAAIAGVLGLPSLALAADALAADALAADRLADDLSSWERLASTCTAEDVVPGQLAPEPICEIVAIDPDQDGFFAAAPLCDPSGASAIAPQPVHPIGNDRMEATPGCDDAPTPLALDRGHDDPGPPTSAPPLDPATLPDGVLAPRWWGLVNEANPGRLLSRADGVRRRLEHPPTGI